ncbi:MAG TPA: hypothetical protein VGP68_24125 [Gemmataceae bacterium]|jgi:hypothetical protein|nr:hypothetical protein [Gemmataceae bacterium]
MWRMADGDRVLTEPDKADLIAARQTLARLLGLPTPDDSCS